MFERKKVLIFDPSPIFRRTLKEVIQASETFVDVAEAGTTGQAEELLKNKHPDVVFLDIALPQHNGIEFIAFIKGTVPDSRIVVLTSHDSMEHREASIHRGADYFLSKERSTGLRLIDVIHATIRR